MHAINSEFIACTYDFHTRNKLRVYCVSDFPTSGEVECMRSFIRSISYGRFFVSWKRCMRSFNGRNLSVDIRTNTGDARLFNILEIVLFADERPL